MPDLESSVAAWREQMLAASISTSELDELESHLREEITQQTRTGSSQPDAFRLAVQKIGQARTLNREFKKASPLSKLAEVLMIFIASLFVLLILFLGTCTVFMCFDTLADRLMAAAAMTCTLAVAFGWKRFVPALPVIASTPKRLLAGLGCVAGGFALATLFCNLVVPHFQIPESHHIPAIGLWMAFFVVVGSTLGVGLALGESERERSGMKKSSPDASEAKVA